MHKPTIQRKTSKSSFYQTFADNDDVFSIRLIVLKLCGSKCDTVENVDFEKCPFPIPYSYSPRTNRFVFTNMYRFCGPNFARRCVVEGVRHI